MARAANAMCVCKCNLNVCACGSSCVLAVVTMTPHRRCLCHHTAAVRSVGCQCGDADAAALARIALGSAACVLAAAIAATAGCHRGTGGFERQRLGRRQQCRRRRGRCGRPSDVARITGNHETDSYFRIECGECMVRSNRDFHALLRFICRCFSP